MTEDFHVPVMKSEVLHHLAPQRGGVYVDGTIGGGGHARAVAELLSSQDMLIGIDLDPEALEFSERALQGVEPVVRLIQGNFKNLPQILRREGADRLDGCLLDLGLSSHQVDTPQRGFSYRFPEAPLDMRMNPESSLTAREIVNEWSVNDLTRIIQRYGEERWARRIARRIDSRRQREPLETCSDLVEVIKEAVPAAARRSGGHPARRTFQAIRIAVNSELTELRESLEQIIDALGPDGRFVVITFHSLEDRPVKQVFRRMASKCRCPVDLPVCRCEGAIVEDLTQKPVRPSEEEIAENRRASSAKLRAVRKIKPATD